MVQATKASASAVPEDLGPVRVWRGLYRVSCALHAGSVAHAFQHLSRDARASGSVYFTAGSAGVSELGWRSRHRLGYSTASPPPGETPSARECRGGFEGSEYEASLRKKCRAGHSEMPRIKTYGQWPPKNCLALEILPGNPLEILHPGVRIPGDGPVRLTMVPSAPY